MSLLKTQDATRSYPEPSGSSETSRSRPDYLIQKSLKNDPKMTQKMKIGAWL